MMTQSKKGMIALQTHRQIWERRLPERNRRMKQHVKGRALESTVICTIARKGNMIFPIIEDTDRFTLHKFVRDTISERVSLVATDEHPGYARLHREFPHLTMNYTETGTRAQ